METRLAPALGTPAGRHAATQAGALFQRLLWLDDSWTAELRDASERGQLSDDDVVVFRDLVQALRRGMDEMPDRAYEVRLMLDELDGDSFETALGRIGEAEAALTGRGAELLPLLQTSMADYELRSASIAGCDYIRERAGDEAKLLGAKLRQIEEAREVPPGDWELPFRCASLIALVGAGVAGTIGLGGPAVFVALTAASGVGFGIREWIKDDCPTELPTIGFRRR